MDRQLSDSFRRKRTTRRVAWTVVSIAVVGGLIFLGASRLRPSVEWRQIRVGLVERGDIEATLRASGTVTPASERVLSSPIEARVLRVLRRPGDTLKAGDPILELDTSGARLELDKLDERLAQNRNALLKAELAAAESLNDLESELEAQRLSVEIADYKLSQHEQLAADGLVSEDKRREIEVALKKDRITLTQLERRIEARGRTHAAEADRLRLEAQIVEREREDAALRLERATTRAEVGGVLTWTIDQPGTTVSRGEIVARIADLDRFRVEATVSDSYAARLELGQLVRIEFDNESLPGRVSTILPQIENGALKFHIKLDDPSHAKLRHNLRVDALVVTGRSHETLVVPRGPFIRGGSETQFIFVLEGDRAVRREARLGLAGHRFMELTEGASEGDEIIISDTSRIIHAREIRVSGRSTP